MIPEIHNSNPRFLVKPHLSFPQEVTQNLT